MAGVRAKDHDDKRHIILNHAAELFAKQGFHKTSIAQIAKACNVTSKAWIYHYFPNKEAVLFTLLRDFIELVTGRVRVAIEPHSDGPTKLRAFVGECLTIYTEYRINYPMLFTEMAFLPDEQRREIRALERTYALLLFETLRVVNPQITRRKHEGMALTMIAFGAMNWTYTWFDEKGALKIDDIAEMITKMILRGIVEP